jgi:hypothetical protein
VNAYVLPRAALGATRRKRADNTPSGIRSALLVAGFRRAVGGPVGGRSAHRCVVLE